MIHICHVVSDSRVDVDGVGMLFRHFASKVSLHGWQYLSQHGYCEDDCCKTMGDEMKRKISLHVIGNIYLSTVIVKIIVAKQWVMR